MDPTHARALLEEMTDGPSLLRHARCVELVMRHLARAAGADEDAWGAAGLLHDADYEKWPEEHPHRIVARLRELGEDAIAHAIAGHYTKWDVPNDTPMSKALIASDELTGFVVACALIRPDGITTLEPKSVKKRFKSKAFAASVERDEVERALAILGVEFADHVQTILDALRPHAEELELAGGRG